MAAIVVARRRHHRDQRVHGRREIRFFSHVLIYLECQKKTLSEHIICIGFVIRLICAKLGILHW